MMDSPMVHGQSSWMLATIMSYHQHHTYRADDVNSWEKSIKNYLDEISMIPPFDTDDETIVFTVRGYSCRGVYCPLGRDVMFKILEVSYDDRVIASSLHDDYVGGDGYYWLDLDLDYFDAPSEVRADSSSRPTRKVWWGDNGFAHRLYGPAEISFLHDFQIYSINGENLSFSHNEVAVQACDPATPPDVLAKFVHTHPSKLIRTFAAYNPNCPNL